MPNEVADIFEMKVHPAADVFPMLPKDELKELAEDIKANGLINPIIIKKGLLIDGRNRREACRIAGVEPIIEEFEGKDPESFIISANINRRHMTKGQRAMAVAMIYPETQQGKKRTSLISKEVNEGYLSKARTVLKHTPDDAQNVLTGALTLDNAYQIAKERKDEAQSTEAKLARIREIDSALADKVIEGELTMAAALAEIQERQRLREQELNSRMDSVNYMVKAGMFVEHDESLNDIKDFLQSEQEYINSKSSRDEIISGLRLLHSNLGRLLEGM